MIIVSTAALANTRAAYNKYNKMILLIFRTQALSTLVGTRTVSIFSFL